MIEKNNKLNPFSENLFVRVLHNENNDEIKSSHFWTTQFLSILEKSEIWKQEHFPGSISFYFIALVLILELWLLKKKNHREVKQKKEKIHKFGSTDLSSSMHPNDWENFVSADWEMTQLRFWFSLSSAKP